MSTTEGPLDAAPPAPDGCAGRRSLPGNRAVVGGLLVAVAVVGTFAAYSGADSAPADRVLVLRKAVSAGETLTADDVRVEPATLPEVVSENVVTNPDDLADAVALVALAAGEIVQRTAVLAETSLPPMDPTPVSSRCRSSATGR